MKKVFFTIMTFVYLTAASGMSFNLHYCMDRLVEVGMTSQHSSECAACMQEAPSVEHQLSCSCCKDEVKQINIENGYKAELTIGSKISFAHLHDKFYSNDYSIVALASVIGSYNINAPPQPNKVPAFLLNCVFRI